MDGLENRCRHPLSTDGRYEVLRPPLRIWGLPLEYCGSGAVDHETPLLALLRIQFCSDPEQRCGWTTCSRTWLGPLDEGACRRYRRVVVRCDGVAPRAVPDVHNTRKRSRPAECPFSGPSRFDCRARSEHWRRQGAVYRIQTGQFHLSLAATPSVALVATHQSSGQSSSVMRLGSEGPNRLLNPSPDWSPERRIETAAPPLGDWSSAFVFLTDRRRLPLARTRHRPQHWQPVGGERESRDVSPLRTVVREVHEEVGHAVDPSSLVWLGRRPADSGEGTVHFWGSIVAPDALQDLVIDDELLEVRWWRAGEAMQLPMYAASRWAVGELAGRIMVSDALGG